MKRTLSLILCGMMLSLCAAGEIPQRTVLDVLIPQSVQVNQ